MNQKAKEAVEYIVMLREKSPDELEQNIKSVAGTVFFNAYASTIISRAPGLASSLMLLGYMCRVNEESGGMNVTQKRANA